MTGRDNGRRRARDEARFDPPSSYGLDRQMLATERARLARAGWQPWEIDQRLLRPQGIPREPT